VRQSVEETRAGGLKVKQTKTGKSRKVTIPPPTVAMLRAHKAEQMRLRLQLGQPGKPLLVFSDLEGRMLSPDNLSRDWRRICRAKGLPKIKFHALRHTHASVLLASGLPVLMVSRRLGHSRASMTLDVYAHLLPDADKAAAQAIEGVLK
jgi:integrase